MKKLLLLLFTLGMLSIPNKSLAQLVAGDIAFIGMNEDTNDGFSFITLTDIPSSEVIFFAEEGWDDDSNSWVGNTETHLQWTAPVAGISCGTVISIIETAADTFTITGGGAVIIANGSTFNFSGGDQVLAYQGAAVKPTTPTFIAAILTDDGGAGPGINATTNWNDNAPYGGQSSGLPSGLTNGVNCVSLYPATFTEQDNSKYTGTLTGTSTVLRAAINDRTNWSSNNTTPFDISPSGYSPSVTCVAPCSEPDVPTVTFGPPTICSGNSALLTISGSLNDAAEWRIYTGSCGGTLVGTTTTSTEIVTPASTGSTTYYVRGEGGCTTAGSCGSVTITVTPREDATFNYGAAAYCADATDPTPTITGVGGGTFSSAAGLSINASSGSIDVSASTPGTYTVNYETSGLCNDDEDVTVTINAVDDASFSYSASSYCVNGTDPSPTITGLAGGTFSSSGGLSINASTGAIDLSVSTPNVYVVTYTTTGTCSNTSNIAVSIAASDDASFSYGSTSYCVDAGDPTPTITGLGGGTFSSTAGLSINGFSGVIDVSTSTPGTYSVTYTTAGACPNSSSVAVTVNALDDAGFTYSASSYITNDSDPTPTITGLAGGTFSVAPTGLVINAATGQIDLSASTISMYTITYTTAGSCTNSSTASIFVGSSTFTWSGATDNDWSTPSNWNEGYVPPNTADIIIPNSLTNYPTSNVAVTFNSMVINSGATFIPNTTVTGPVTYKRNLPTTNWYIVASPVNGETQQDVIANHTFASGSGSNIGIGGYSNNIGPSWIYSTGSTTGFIPIGVGVSMKLAAPGDVSITGDVIPLNIAYPISQGTGDSFNLLGNPYTAYMNSATFATTNSALLTEETVWLWNGTSYVTYNAVSPIEIAPAQGYFIEASTNSNVLYETINRSHQSSDTFMKQKPTSNFELFVESGDDKQATKVFYVADKTTGFDNGYDSKMFGGVTSDFSIFTELVANNQGKQLAIQTLPNENLETMVIPVGIIADAGKELTFSVTSLNLPENISVFLEDRVNNEFINLSDNEYKTTLATASNGSGQFYVHTTSQKLSTDDVIQNLNTISIYKSAKQEITITGLQSDGKVSVYSLLGKKVFTTEITSNGNTKISLPTLADGVYIVRLASEYGEKTSKIILD